MGMFDTIQLEGNPCGLPTPKGNEYQTKSLDCNLDVYQINPEGCLVYNQDADTRKRFYAGDELIRIREGSYTGWVNFYRNDLENKWREFNAYLENNRIRFIIESGGNIIFSDDPEKNEFYTRESYKY
jgi:hypothetical protein